MIYDAIIVGARIFTAYKMNKLKLKAKILQV